jgi:hypothetical protein
LSSLLVAVALVAAAGCGPSMAKLSGKVTYKGSPLKGGTVTFIPEGSGETFSTKIQEDGSYAFDHIRTGKYKVCVETTSVRGGGGSGGGPGAGAAYGGKQSSSQDRSKIKNAPPPDANVPEGYRTANPFTDPAEAAKRYAPIPPDYADKTKTKLTYEVKGGVQEHDIPLD